MQIFAAVKTKGSYSEYFSAYVSYMNENTLLKLKTTNH